jgi:hypothetical protein
MSSKTDVFTLALSVLEAGLLTKVVTNLYNSQELNTNLLTKCLNLMGERYSI